MQVARIGLVRGDEVGGRAAGFVLAGMVARDAYQASRAGNQTWGAGLLR
jgi:hypothetical protein